MEISDESISDIVWNIIRVCLRKIYNIPAAAGSSSSPCVSSHSMAVSTSAFHIPIAYYCRKYSTDLTKAFASLPLLPVDTAARLHLLSGKPIEINWATKSSSASSPTPFSG